MKNTTTVKAKKRLSGLLKAGLILLMITGWIGQEATGQTTSAQKAVVENLHNNENVNLENVRVSVNFEETPLDEAILRLGKISGINFNYNAKLLSGEMEVSHRAMNRALSNILDSILPGNVTYIAVRNMVILREKEEDEVNPEDYFQETVQGRVIDGQTNEPLPGVSIVIQGTQLGTATDANGEFELGVPSLGETLRFTFIGYEALEIPLEGRTELDVVMTMMVEEFGEVLVGAYAPQRRRDVTGSISSIDFEAEANIPVGTRRVDEMIQGRTAGVEIRSPEGNPGGEMIIRIRGIESFRGDNSPLIVVDGLQGADLRSLNPADIESVEILKDASATAMYGSEGSAGVVLVTTRKGRAGTPQFQYSYDVGVQQTIMWPRTSPGDWARWINEIEMANNVGRDPVPWFSDEQIATFERGEGVTDWADELFRTAMVQSHDLSISGATESLNYRISGSHFDQDGIMLNSHFNRSNLRVNLNSQLTDWADASFSMGGSRATDSAPYTTGSASIRSATAGVNRFPYSVPVFDEDGNYNHNAPDDFPVDMGTAFNPIASAVEHDTRNQENRLNVNASLNFEFIEGLSLNLSGGGLITDRSRWDYFRPDTQPGAANNGLAQISETDFRRYQTTGNLTYLLDVGRHSLTTTVVAEQKWEERTTLSLSNSDFPNPETTFFDMGGATIQNTSSGESERLIRSGLARINYDFDDRYLLTASVRRDGSSVFGADNKWGTFPAFSAGWRLSSEPYLDIPDAITNLLLRASWGVTGNQAISPYQSLAVIRSVGNYPYDGPGINTGFMLTRSANPNLKWETTEQLNLGIDLELLGGQFFMAADYYKKSTDDMLMLREVPSHTGVGNILDNVGAVENEGFEFLIGGRGQFGQMRWRSTFNFSHNNSTVTDLGDNFELITRGAPGGHGMQTSDFHVMRIRVGDGFGNMYGWETDGTWNTDEADEAAEFGQLPGDIRYVDVNGDGVIDVEDIQKLGNTQPDYSLGLNTSLGYRGWDLSFLLQGQLGHYVINGSRAMRAAYGLDPKAVNDRWTVDNQDTSEPAIIDAQTRADAGLVSRINIPSGGENMTDRFLEDGSYLRLKSLALSYTLPSTLVSRLSLRNVRVYASGSNLLTFTGYSGTDPEASSFHSDFGDGSTGSDVHTFPNARFYNFGVEIAF